MGRPLPVRLLLKMPNRYNPKIHKRRSIRLRGYDYSQAGAYYVTVCIQSRECLFGDVIDGEMVLNHYGHVVETEWLKTPMIRSYVDLDEYVVMPNHFHGILVITDAGATRRVAPTVTLQPGSLGAIMGQFESIASKTIRRLGLPHFQWQRNYHEHIIRDESDLNRIREYIINNPLRWAEDENNPLPRL